MKIWNRYISMLISIGMLFSFSFTASVAAEPEELPVAGLSFEQYPSLKDQYKDYFLIGTTGTSYGVRGDLLNHHFNSYTFENSMKPENTQRTKDSFTFTASDDIYRDVKAVAPDMQFVGHTLSWHSQSPNWMWDHPNFDYDTAKANLEEHFTAVLEHFGANLYAMDVVNEAVGSSDPGDWKSAVANKGEGWGQALGADFIELAFLKAAEIVDNNGWDCKLYYNEISIESYSKTLTVYEMVKEINEKYAGVRKNGKPLIEGIGIQGHYNKNAKLKDIEATVEKLATLPGVKLSFTEADIEWLNTGSLTQEDSIKQAQKYAQLFQIFKKYAAGPGNTSGNPQVIERVTFWGSDDGTSWKATNFPLLFNAPVNDQITGKEALLAALDPDAYLEKHPAVEEEEEEIKHIDGIYVYSADNGDSFTGANIILGSNASQWPWSTPGTDGKAAFIPEKDATYRISVNYTPLGTNMIQMRWLSDESSANYTKGDADAIGSAQTPAHNETATEIPAYFNNGMINGMAYTLVTEVKLDGSQSADGLIGNIAIRGGSNGNSFTINWINIEKIGNDGTASFAANWPDGPPPRGTEGVHVWSTDDGEIWSGANIILGNNAEQWPWSTAEEDGKVAFTPEKDTVYRFTIDYTSFGTSAIRVRWVKDNTNGGYTQGDAAVVNNSQIVGPDEIATQVPAYFNKGMEQGETYILKTDIKMDGAELSDGLIGNIAIRGGSGGNSFVINQIMVEKLSADGEPEELLVNWPDGLPDEPEPEIESEPEEETEQENEPESATSETEASPEPATTPQDTDGNGGTITVVIILAVLAAVAFFFIKNKGKSNGK